MEGRQVIFDIREQYSEIYHLEGVQDTLTFTDATEHEIRLKKDQQPVYRRHL